MIRCVVKQKQATFEWKKTPVTLLHGESLPSEKKIFNMEMDDFFITVFLSMLSSYFASCNRFIDKALLLSYHPSLQ